MNNEPEPGMGFVPTVGRGRIDPAPPPAPVVNFNIILPPEALKALQDTLVWIVLLALVVAAFSYGPKLLRG